MAVYKDNNGTWYISVRYVNWKGEHARKVKRGFATKREATDWERNFLHENAGNLDMSFETFVDLYKKNLKERLKPVSFYAFEILYWCGLRLGEMLALTPSDFNFEKNILRINKSYQKIGTEDVITDPKTPKSIRNVQMPDFLADEMQDYISSLYEIEPDQRIFPITKSYMHNEMTRGSKAAGVKRIRIHDLRHSHVSLLIEMGFGAVAIADRVGHESIDITYRYAHLFPTTQQAIADKLNMERS